MALPSVTVTISEDTFRPSSGEASGTFIAGAVILNNDIVKALGTTSEVVQGYIHFTGLEDLNSRLSLNSGNSAEYVFPGFSGGDGATYASTKDEVRFPSGPIGATLRHQFHTIETASQYGAQVIVGTESASPFTTSTIPLDCIFAADINNGIGTVVLNNIRTARGNDVLSVHGTTDGNANVDNANTKYDVWVHGRKEYIPDASTIENEISLYGSPIKINLAADAVDVWQEQKELLILGLHCRFSRGKY